MLRRGGKAPVRNRSPSRPQEGSLTLRERCSVQHRGWKGFLPPLSIKERSLDFQTGLGKSTWHRELNDSQWAFQGLGSAFRGCFSLGSAGHRAPEGVDVWTWGRFCTENGVPWLVWSCDGGHVGPRPCSGGGRGIRCNLRSGRIKPHLPPFILQLRVCLCMHAFVHLRVTNSGSGQRSGSILYKICGF